MGLTLDIIMYVDVSKPTLAGVMSPNVGGQESLVSPKTEAASSVRKDSTVSEAGPSGDGYSTTSEATSSGIGSLFSGRPRTRETTSYPRSMVSKMGPISEGSEYSQIPVPDGDEFDSENEKGEPQVGAHGQQNQGQGGYGPVGRHRCGGGQKLMANSICGGMQP